MLTTSRGYVDYRLDAVGYSTGAVWGSERFCAVLSIEDALHRVGCAIPYRLLSRPRAALSRRLRRLCAGRGLHRQRILLGRDLPSALPDLRGSVPRRYAAGRSCPTVPWSPHEPRTMHPWPAQMRCPLTCSDLLSACLDPTHLLKPFMLVQNGTCGREVVTC